MALGGDCLADIALLRSEPGLYGPVASDATGLADHRGPGRGRPLRCWCWLPSILPGARAGRGYERRRVPMLRTKVPARGRRTPYTHPEGR